MTEYTPEQLAKMEDVADEILEELRQESAAREQLRVFAIHGDSSNFDQDDAKAIARLVEARDRRIREVLDLQTEVDRLRASNADAMRVVADTRRLLSESDAEKEPLRAEIARLREAIVALHVPDGAWSPFCDECGHAYPCATARVLED